MLYRSLEEMTGHTPVLEARRIMAALSLPARLLLKTLFFKQREGQAPSPYITRL